MLSWEISSSSGRERVKFSVDHTPAPGRKAVMSIRLSRDFWKRGTMLGDSELVPDVRLELPQVVLEEGGLRQLLSNFDSWINERAHFQQSMEASGGSDQILRLSLGRASDFIYSSEKPAFTVAVRFGGYYSSDSSFVVDETCIRLARDSLANLLAEIDG